MTATQTKSNVQESISSTYHHEKEISMPMPSIVCTARLVAATVYITATEICVAETAAV